jgi:hypothetical protein
LLKAARHEPHMHTVFFTESATSSKRSISRLMQAS